MITTRVAATALIASAALLAGAAPAAATGSATGAAATGAAAARFPVPLPGGVRVTGPVPAPSSPLDSPAGQTCAFAIHTEPTVDRVRAYTATDSTGRTVATAFTGALFVRIRNVSNGHSVVVDLSGSAVRVPAADGSSTLYGAGPFATLQHPGDTPGPGYLVLDGLSALRVGADGHKTVLYSGRATDVCPTIA